ncbi:MAG: hypothetical protein M1829_003429 [Trizodia sp. TS-e1964]|nr:MAG: hypothetical protein M1829_003429 [Trizodia sp. TS-e1964]
MASVVRQPYTLTSAIAATRNLSKNACPHTAIRAFSKSPFKFSTIAQSSSRRLFSSKPSSHLALLEKTQDAFKRAYSRSYMQTGSPVYAPQARNIRQRLLYGAGIFGGTVVAINLVFNRETREDGGMPAFERSFLNETFLHTGLGIGIIGIAARTLHQSGWSYRLMATNPWLVMGLGLAASVGSMFGTFATDPDNYVQKYALWGVFNLTQAAILTPLMFMQPAVLARAGLYTMAMMGSIAFVGATAKQDKYLYLGAPLLAGVAVVAVSGLAPLVLPATAVRSLMWTENLWLYGGLAVFGGFTLYDVQKVLHHARLAEGGLMKRDAVNESIRLELDFLNIFIRMVQILGMRSNNRK